MLKFDSRLVNDYGIVIYTVNITIKPTYLNIFSQHQNTKTTLLRLDTDESNNCYNAPRVVTRNMPYNFLLGVDFGVSVTKLDQSF